jgi:ribulose-phosphate 3-epimerase
MVEIIPSILTNDAQLAIDMLKQAEGVAKRVQIDIIDGVFADNKTIDPIVLQDIETTINLDYHLMVKEPINWIEKSIHAGGERIIGHVEMMSDPEAFIFKIHAAGRVPGLGIDLDTPLIEVDEHLLAEIGVVIVMSSKAGFGGQEFQQSVLEKIATLHEIRAKNGYQFKICDDGGVTLNWADDVRRKGTDEIAIGNRIFNGNLAENMKQFQDAAGN